MNCSTSLTVLMVLMYESSEGHKAIIHSELKLCFCHLSRVSSLQRQANWQLDVLKI